MTTFFRTLAHDKRLIRACLVGLAFLAVSLVVNFYAVHYATLRASGSVDDIVLSNIPAVDVDGIFVWGPIIMWAFVVWLLVYKPQRIPFTFKSVALFTVVRAAFVTLTHIGPFPTHDVIVYGNVVGSLFNSGADLFFSGHTGLPVLLALIFWKDTVLRRLFIGASLFFGVVVLLGHLHYSIDVLSAFFITYTIYHMARILFPADVKIFEAVTYFDPDPGAC